MKKSVKISGAYAKMIELSNIINEYAKTHVSLSCAKLFEMAGKGCPDEFVGYGWKNIKRELNDGYFYVYTGKLDESDVWYIECPETVKL